MKSRYEKTRYDFAVSCWKADVALFVFVVSLLEKGKEMEYIADKVMELKDKYGRKLPDFPYCNTSVDNYFT